jgi:asparagine synthase (glutamine-hydrolysing)
MCGIAGAIGSVDTATVKVVQRMTEAQSHRGPDQAGLWSSVDVGRGVVFGHRRLSILDLSEAGRQPMIDRASGVVIAFNGEVYNFAELARDLVAAGDEIVSTCDTEVILKAYARWGERAIDRMRGMFAIALYDPRDETVLFARDRLGIKPLYYAEVERRLLFASEVRAILASELVDRKIDAASLESFVWHGFVPGPRTIVEGISLLPPGTTMRVGLDGRARTPHRYWSVPRARPLDEEQSVRELRTR